MDVPDAFVVCKAQCGNLEDLLSVAKVDSYNVVAVYDKSGGALYAALVCCGLGPKAAARGVCVAVALAYSVDCRLADL